MMLDGVRVIELGTTITAPLASMLLADLGADVIKVERPGGDPFRSFREGADSPHFLAYNRNKRSVVLDLTDERQKAELVRLITDADVLVDNYRPEVLERLGLSPQTLQEFNARLIHCSITGFGSQGPARDRPAYDAVAQALSGIAGLFLDTARPVATGPTISDNVTGMYACYGLLGALFERTRSGRGRRLEVNMLEASMAFIPDAFSTYTQLGVVPDQFTRVASSQSFAFGCSDGLLIAIHLSSVEKFWLALLGAIDMIELSRDDRFASRMQRMKHYAALRAVLAARFIERPRSEWLARLSNVDVPFAPVHAVADVLEDPQVRALQATYRLDDPVHGTITGIYPPVLVDGQRPSTMTGAPTLGEHTADVLGNQGAPSKKPD